MRNILRVVLSICLLAVVLPGAYGQDPRLALQYMQDGEYEKAADLFRKLYEKSGGNDYYFNNYIESLLQLEAYDTCARVIEEAIRKTPQEGQLYVTYGNVLDRMGKPEEADKQYAAAIRHLRKDKFAIIKLGNAFTSAHKYELAIQVFEKGDELLRGENAFAYNLADLYRRQGNGPKMIHHYLNSLESNPGSLETVKTIFQRFLAEEEFAELQSQLYTRLQEQQDNALYPELLAWVFMQKKDFRNALRQLRAIDRRLQENGQRIFNLGHQAAYEEAYDVALEAFDYIVTEKGRNSSYFIEAKKAALSTKRKMITNGTDYDMAALRQLETEYKAFLEEFGYNSLTAPIITELADLQTYYINDLPGAIATLNALLQYKGVNRYVLANAKLNLGDFYLMNGERWEATLLYSQVDKDFGEELLGQEARFRNARLSYYVGDFEWAQQQFNVLKTATSKFIANDALDLSVFIMDNMGLDTTDQPLKWYAAADLLIFQNRYTDAQHMLDSIRTVFPQHPLEDDVLYLEGRMAERRKQYALALEKYERIAEEFKADIRADNALFAMGVIYAEQLDQPDKAMACFERLFLEYNSSTFAVDARKRYRQLRGDSI